MTFQAMTGDQEASIHAASAFGGYDFPAVDDDEDMPKPKLLLVGHGRHGKDTVADMFTKFGGFTWQSSSLACAKHVCLPHFNNHPRLPSYETAEACFEDRHGSTRVFDNGAEFNYDHRSEWFNAIDAYNTPDKTRLARTIMEENDIYVGMRSRRELWACQAGQVFDYVIWVDRSDHLPPEGSGSMQIEPWMADLHIDNNGSLTETEINVRRVIGCLEEWWYNA